MSKNRIYTLQKILTALLPYRDLAEWFLLLLKEWWNDELIEQLYNNIVDEIKNIKSESQQEKVKKVLKKLKEKSDATIKKDEEWAEQLLNDLINNI